MKSNRRVKKQTGFTLIEIMVVVAIIGILAAVVGPQIFDRPDEARQVKARQDIGTLVQALELYRLDNFVYPSTEQGLQALVEEPSGDPEPANWKEGGYIKKVPNDPWGREYDYISPGEESDFDIISYGRDGVEGGEGFDSDLTSNDL
ncbi:type II secretion system major pseudopilin GspG [Granulosicoccaceae sp. 1_MG-2023]|nr:type II secretion system major pseudopilin GspG [Granulosicoccaceae sp. 1_MG-2023]